MKEKFSDLEKERNKYNEMATKEKIELGANLNSKSSLQDISELIRPPFELYYKELQNLITSEMTVLELGAGTGTHTAVAIETNAKVIALDISEISMKVCKSKFPSVHTIVANMESIPLDDNSIDLIYSCGSLSYGDSLKVQSEIYRLLKPGGSLIILDTLNHNLLYRMNRWIHMKRGIRTRSTLNRMPTQQTIQDISKSFTSVQVTFFGSYLWFCFIISKILGYSMACKLNRFFELRFASKKNAFKFVLKAQGLKA